MSYSPIGDLVAEHLRRARMLRAEFEDERARLQAKGDELLAEPQAAEQEPVTEPQPVVDLDAIRREEQQRETMARAAAEQVGIPAAGNEFGAAGQRPATAEQHVPPSWSTPSAAASLDEDTLREAREAMARSAAARRAAERVEPVDYDGFDQESEYFRGKNWFG